MKLRDLDAEFFGGVTPAPAQTFMRQGERLAGAQGVMLQCPKCAEGKEAGAEDGRRFVRGAHYLLVLFQGRGVPEDAMPGIARWQMTGTGLDDLTTRPSILLKGGCGWHGYITKGETVDA